MGVGQDRGRSDKVEERWGLGRLSFGFSFEQSKAWTSCNGPWAVIFALVDGFVVKMGYPVFLVPDKAAS
jgi:hypothetical protein